MRQAIALVLLILLVSPTTGTDSTSKARGSLKALSGRSESAVSSAPTPSGFVVPSAVADPSCNGGQGVRLPTGLNTGAVIASGTMADGSTLIATSVLYPDKSFALLHFLLPDCEPDPSFGVDGQATILSPRFVPTHRPRGGVTAGGLWIDAVASRNGGGAIVAGSYKGVWAVGEVTSRGQLDPKFGDRGWIALPFLGEVTAALQQPSGRILIAGDNGGGGCCNRNWAAALSAGGQLETRFGTHGRTELPTGEDSGVGRLVVEANGDILTQVGFGNMGCWGLAVAMLAPSGRPLRKFQHRLDEFWKKLKFGAFVGDVYVDSQGFSVVGTGEPSCDGYHKQPSTGVTARFRADGTQIGHTTRFASRMYGDIDAFQGGGDTFVLASPYGDQSQLTITALRPDGSTDRRFGTRGRAQIGTPWRGSKHADNTMVVVTHAGPLAATLVATVFGDSPMHIVRLRF